MSERDEIAALLDAHWISHHGTTIEGFRPCTCSCGWTHDCVYFGGWAACDGFHRRHLADLLAERDRRTAAEALRAMGKRFRTEARETWGADVLWTTTGSKVATLAASWCDNEADRVEQP